MSVSTHASMRELQDLDTRIEEVRTRVESYELQLEEVAGPAAALVRETELLRNRLKDMRSDERRLEAAADDKRARTKRLQDRLNNIRNLREEAALRVEMDLVRRAMEADEQEAMSLLDGINRAEDSLEDLEARRVAALEEVEPRRLELLKEQEDAQAELRELEEARRERADSLGDRERRLYESYRAGGRTVVVVSLTGDGACGFCFSMVPLQLQSEVRRGTSLIRCEACGVILAPPQADAGDVEDTDG